MYMNVNGIKFYNNYDIDTNNKCQSNKLVKFCGSKDAYVSSEKKKNEASKKRKRNWIIAGVCTAVAATVTGFLYFNGKKVKKTSNVVEHAKNQVSEISQNSIKKYADYLKQDNIKASVLRTNIKEMNELLKQNPDEKIAETILKTIFKHFEKLTDLTALGLQERIDDINNYYIFLKQINEENEFLPLLKANKECLEYERDIAKNDIEKNIENLSKVIDNNENNNIGTIYQQEFIETLLDKEQYNKKNTTQILKTITNNTKINKQKLIEFNNNFYLNIVKNANTPFNLMGYLQKLSYKNLETIYNDNDKNNNSDNALAMYNILTVNKLKNIIHDVKKENDSITIPYTIDKNTLSGKQSAQEYIFNFLTQEYNLIHIKEIDPKDKEKLEVILKSDEMTLQDKKTEIIKMFKQYQGNSDFIKTLLEIINKNTSENDIENAKNKALEAFKDSLQNDYSEQNVINALQSTVDTFYKKDNYYSGLLQDCLVGNEIESAQECNNFDDKYIGLVYGLGVCRHMAKLVNYLITTLNQERIQTCSIDNGGHAWNYLRFKNGDNNYTYYKVDTYNSIFVKLDNEEEISKAFKDKYKDNVSIDNAFEFACY